MSDKQIVFDPWSRKQEQGAPVEVPLPCGVTLTLRKLGALETSAALDEAAQLCNAHIPNERNRKTVTPFVGADKKTYELNETLVKELCLLRHMQVGPRFSFSWWLGLALWCEDDYAVAATKAQALNSGNEDADEEEDSGN
jgi:hypothetical protein